jgi:hypothetical protein
MQDCNYENLNRTLTFPELLTEQEHVFYSVNKRHVWQRARAWAADHRARAGYPSSTLGAGSRQRYGRIRRELDVTHVHSANAVTHPALSPSLCVTVDPTAFLKTSPDRSEGRLCPPVHSFVVEGVSALSCPASERLRSVSPWFPTWGNLARKPGHISPFPFVR